MIEEWRDIPDYEGYYQVSNLGQVRSLDREIIKSDGKIEKRKGKIISIQYRKDVRYKYVMLYNKSSKRHFLHRLLYQAFVGEIKKGCVIDHINNDQLDNRIENLQCITIRENSSKDTISKKNGKLTGAFKETRYEAYSAKIWLNGKQIRLGTFKTEEEAHQAYINKLNEIQHN